jgi:hypothetical protein
MGTSVTVSTIDAVGVSHPFAAGALPVYVIATRRRDTIHALTVAQALAHEQHRRVSLLVSPPQRITISSARANVRNLVVEVPVPADLVTPDTAKALLTPFGGEVDLQIADVHEAPQFAVVIPTGATVVIAGAVHHFRESHEQRLARKLTDRGYQVVFLPGLDS